MAEHTTTRQELITALNGDLAREYQAVIAYVVYSQVIKGAEYMAIAKELEKHATQELAHALTISKHIDYLGGTPDDQGARGEDVGRPAAAAAVRPRQRERHDARTTACGCGSARRCRSTASRRTSARSCARSRSIRSTWRPRSARTCPTWPTSPVRAARQLCATLSGCGGGCPRHRPQAARAWCTPYRTRWQATRFARARRRRPPVAGPRRAAAESEIDACITPSSVAT